MLKSLNFIKVLWVGGGCGVGFINVLWVFVIGRDFFEYIEVLF